MSTEWPKIGTVIGPRGYRVFEIEGPRLVLVGCSAGKLDRPAPARELYTSTLFRLARAYADSTGEPWAILSALHGVIPPGKVTDPYDRELKGLHRDYLEQWRNRVDWKLRVHYPGCRRVLVLAGGLYRQWLPEWLDVEEPMAGLGVGKRLAWLKANTRTEDQ